MAKPSVALPAEVWRAVEAAVADYLRFGPGDLEAEYVPDEHLEAALKAIRKAVSAETTKQTQEARR
jgi:hypothetical protein